MDEERRLLYVAMTRAKFSLYLSHCKTRFFFGVAESNQLSQFISEVGVEKDTRARGGNVQEDEKRDTMMRERERERQWVLSHALTTLARRGGCRSARRCACGMLRTWCRRRCSAARLPTFAWMACQVAICLSVSLFFCLSLSECLCLSLCLYVSL
jgi:hypothetical protein